MARNDWAAKAAFMREVGATEATWDGPENDTLVTLKLAPQQPKSAATQPAPGPAAKLANAFAERVKRDHDVRFAASHFKPRFEPPQTHDDVPRAVRAKQGASSGRASTK